MTTLSSSPAASLPSAVPLMRIGSAVMVGIVVLDVIDVRAPFLAVLAVPFLIAAVGLRRGSLPAVIALALWSALHVVLGVSYALAHKFDAGWGDLLFTYAGTPVAAALIALVVRHRMHPVRPEQ